MLALEAGGVVSTDQLVDRLWEGRAPPTAVATLQVYVSQLRKLLGSKTIATRRPGYALAIPPNAVDAVEFERLALEGRALRGDGEMEATRLAFIEAVSLWRGAALGEFIYEEWAAAPARHLEELRVVAQEDLVDARLALGASREVVGELGQLVTQFPLRERLRGQLMLALYRSGRQADALAAFQDARRALVDDLGIDPSRELVELERRILQQDPALRPAVAAGVSPDVPSGGAAIPAAATQRSGDARVGDGRLAVETPTFCPQCGAKLSMTAKFCAECGSALGVLPTSARQEQRKLVSVLFCDVVGSTGLAERLDAEVLRGLLGRYFDAASAMISRHGGSVEKFIGDAVVALFGVPAAEVSKHGLRVQNGLRAGFRPAGVVVVPVPSPVRLNRVDELV
jgi:DNA-binding SARP family transcriptional activator